MRAAAGKYSCPWNNYRWRAPSRQSIERLFVLKFAERQRDTLAGLGAADDGFRELHVRDAGFKSRQLDRPAFADRRDEVGLDVPRTRLFLRNRNFLQFAHLH